MPSTVYLVDSNLPSQKKKDQQFKFHLMTARYFVMELWLALWQYTEYLVLFIIYLHLLMV